MNKAVKFSDLKKDIIVAVLLWCDIRTILRVEQVCVSKCSSHSASRILTLRFPKTCKDLRDLISSRHLWLALVQNLDHHHAPNLLPHETLQSLSVDNLREIAIRAVRGRLNWTSSKGPEATWSTVLKLKEAHDNAETQGMLVPGGSYFVFQAEDGCFHCYDIEEKINICSHQPPPDAESVECIDCLIDIDEPMLILAYLAGHSDKRL